MTLQTIDIGDNENDGTGDNLRVAYDKTNSNFEELDALQSETINAAGFPGASDEEKIQSAINQAVAESAARVAVPATMIPYNAALVTHDNDVQMVREGGDWSVYEVEAYGADATGTAASNKIAIQEAINASAANRSICALSQMYEVSDVISCPDFTVLVGKGVGSGLRASAAHTSTILVNDDTVAGNADIRLYNFEVDGNKANRSAGINLIHITTASGTYNERITIENIYAHDSQGTGGSHGLGIILSRCHGGRIVGCHVANNERDGITCYFDCQDVLVANNWIHDCADDFIGLNAEDSTSNGHTMTRMQIIGNTLAPLGTDAGAGIAVRGVTNSIVANNIIFEGFSAGVDISNWNQSPSTDVVVANNISIDAGSNNTGANGIGIALTSARGVSSLSGKAGCERISITGNIIKNPRAHGIRIVGESTVTTRDILIAQNTISCGTLYTSGRGIIGDVGPATDIHVVDNLIKDSQAHGIFFSDTSSVFSRINVERNRVYSPGKSGSTVPTAAGIELEAVVDAVVRDNRSTDLAATDKTSTYGVRIVNCTGSLSVTGNDCRNNGTSLFNFSGTTRLSQLRVRDNVGYSPWAGQANVTSGSWSSSIIGGWPFWFKDVTVTYTIPFPATATPLPLLTCDATGVAANARTPSNSTFSVRAWSIRSDSPAVVVYYNAEPNV